MDNLMEKLVSLCKQRGFIFPSSEIYGGIGGFWDFGPLGVRLTRNLKNLWWQEMVLKNDNIYPLDSTVIHNPKVWEASGHTVSFTDPLQECKSCHKRFRVDHLKGDKCPECQGKLTEVKQFNLMFKTFIGPTEETASKAYLRPETCQGIYINFAGVVDSMRPKLPFGIAQIGKAFRNEITTGNFIFRDREMEQMEMEYFVDPKEDEKYFEDWKEKRMKWYLNVLKLNKNNLRFFDHPKESLAHYSKRTVDIEFKFPFGWGELEGVANRTDYDLKTHSKHSGKDLSLTNDKGEKVYPYVIEPSVGVERLTLAVLVDSYKKDKDREILAFDPKVAPFKAAVFPLLSNKQELVKKARSVYDDLRKDYEVNWDDRGNIGKRYYAQDQIGTPFCLTIDFDSLKKDDLTVRDRDTTKQERVSISNLKKYLKTKLEE